MATYAELLKQRQELEKAIQDARKNEVTGAVQKIRSLVEEYGLTTEQIFGNPSKKEGTRTVAAKYRDPETGQTWTGRGKAPKWIEGKNRESFLIKEVNEKQQEISLN